MDFEKLFKCKGDTINYSLSPLQNFPDRKMVQMELDAKILQCIEMVRLSTDIHKVLITGTEKNIIKINYFAPYIQEGLNKSIFIRYIRQQDSGLLFLPLLLDPTYFCYLNFEER